MLALAEDAREICARELVDSSRAAFFCPSSKGAFVDGEQLI